MTTQTIETTTTVDPFASKLTAARQREAATALLIEERRQARAAEAESARKAAAERERIQGYITFGRKFKAAVANRVVNDRMSSGEIERIGAYCDGMLALATKPPAVLPQLKESIIVKILEKFSYGMVLAANNGVEIPADFFYGQVLLAERKAQKEAATGSGSKLDRVTIRPGDKPRGPRQEATAEVVDLLPAITPKGSRKSVKANA